MQKKWLMAEWRNAKENGISMDVEGVSYDNRTPQELWQVMQRGSYMLDYEADPAGKIVALHFDRVEPSKNRRK